MLTVVAEGYVKEVLALREGVSQRTNSAWRRQGYLLEVPEGGRATYLPIEVADGAHGMIAALGLKEGDHIRVTLGLRGSKWQDRWYVDTPEVWRVERI